MKYAVLPAPHSNARYNASLLKLTLSELTLMLAPHGIKPEAMTMSGLELISFECDENPQLEKLASCASSAMAVFAVSDGMLRPIEHQKQSPVENDISGVLKYKGKTNETFTSLLINAAVHSSDFSNKYDERINVLDPICGRGTALYEGLKKGYNVSGVEIDKTDIDELNKYFKKYLEYHRLKHTLDVTRLTVNGKAGGTRYAYSLADNAQGLKQNPYTLCAVLGSTVNCPSYFKKSYFHAIAADLPYGVQHSGQDGKRPIKPALLLDKAIDPWKTVLKPGGAIAISYNTNTLSTQQARQIMSDHGIKPLEGGVYDEFEHWVEQAVTRDIAIGILD